MPLLPMKASKTYEDGCSEKSKFRDYQTLVALNKVQNLCAQFRAVLLLAMLVYLPRWHGNDEIPKLYGH